ncbi:hypothetical protein Tco_0037984 [Tanacetum coccineum]
MATVVASRVMVWWCTAGVMAAVDGDDVVGEDDDGEVVMERSGGYSQALRHEPSTILHVQHRWRTPESYPRSNSQALRHAGPFLRILLPWARQLKKCS